LPSDRDESSVMFMATYESCLNASVVDKNVRCRLADRHWRLVSHRLVFWSAARDVTALGSAFSGTDMHA